MGFQESGERLVERWQVREEKEGKAEEEVGKGRDKVKESYLYLFWFCHT